ncbi:alpha/beta hydrolase [Streptomyces beijiangensis]|uniref:Esterase n=1 Tax=Streptomyces beijiangensis TaxID=163361 RepID=A0A939JGH7_9ACTN|nr:alpha/beta hydrolase-fold protein [Streptomyces beijiangensis]MBO0513438.1 esterase [Streptomyces beijiangensis]
MGLTSHKVLALAVVLATVLFVVTILFWPRLARRTWRAVVGRIGLLLATQLAIFTMVGLLANNSFLFYGSWADLVGREQTPGVVVDHAAGTARSGSRSVQVLGKQELDVKGGRGPRVSGQIQKVLIDGQASRIASPAYIYLPPEYFQAKYAKRTFPATVVLTGYPGVAMNLIKGLAYPQTALKLARAGRMQPMVLVMMRPTVAPPRDTECVDVPGGPQAETFFAKDVPRAVHTSYRVGSTARSWGFVGDSTGGYCALKIAMHHPNVYGAGAGLSAYYKAAEDVTTGDLFHGDAKARHRADLLRSLGQLPAPDVSLMVTTSRQGEGNYKNTMKFLAKAKPPTRVSSMVLENGGHNFNTWRREIPATLEWLSGRLTG